MKDQEAQETWLLDCVKEENSPRVSREKESKVSRESVYQVT